MTAGMKVGITIPSFQEDPEVVIGVARAAEEAGLDGVFAFDHLFRPAPDGTRRPSFPLDVVLGAVAAETSRVTLGSLVARATVRHPASLAVILDTVHRLAPGRLVAGVGSGDELSDPEQEAFGLPDERVPVRMAALERTLEATRGRGFPVWVGGLSDRMIAAAAALADGWNGWGVSVEGFARRVADLAEAASAADRPEPVEATWGGLVELRPDWPHRSDTLGGGGAAIADALRRYEDAGATWAVLGPIDSSDPANPAIIAEQILPALRS